jgi:hypothetical protein
MLMSMLSAFRGVPLSQYLQMARYVRIHFNPDIFVINVVHNDFAESLCSVKKQVGMLCLEDNRDSMQEASIIPYNQIQCYEWSETRRWFGM